MPFIKGAEYSLIKRYLIFLIRSVQYFLRILYYFPEDDHIGSKHVGRIKCKIYTSCILSFVDCASLYNPVNKANLVLSFSQYVYLFSLHVSGIYVPIIRRNNRIYSTLGTCYSETNRYFKITRPYVMTYGLVIVFICSTLGPCYSETNG
jgi:hypothetical protein